MRVGFGEFELDTDTCTLREAGEPRVLQRKVFDVLRFLIEQRDRVVGKDELLDAIWPGEPVNEAAVAWSVFHARRALGQDRRAKHPIETVHGRGYRFVAELRPASGSPATSANTSTQSSDRTMLPLVGRGDVMKRLDSWLDDAVSGRGRLGVLVGEAGVGKTRCASELRERARTRGVSVCAGRTVDDLGAPVFWPWLEILRDLARQRVPLREQARALHAQLSGLEAPSGAAKLQQYDGAAAFAVLGEICDLLYEACVAAPVVILLDDLQWADAGTLSLLRLLAVDLPRHRLLIVATLREDVVTARTAAVSALAQKAELLTLKRLSEQDVSNYVAQLTLEAAPSVLTRSIHAFSAGNPLYMEEIVRVLSAEHGASALATLSTAQIEATLLEREVLQARLQRTATAVQNMLRVASVLGETFELSLLQELCGLDTEALLDQLEPAVRQVLIFAEAPHRYRFSHALVREAVYAQLSLSERITLHRRAGDLLLSLPAAERRHNEIAHHYHRSLPAGDHARVVDATARAARAAVRVHAFDDAATLYAWALEAHALDPAGKLEIRLELLLRRGFVQRHAGHETAARETLLRALELGNALRDPAALLRASRVLRSNHTQSGLPDSQVHDALEAALRLANPAEPKLEISARSQLACIPPYALDLEKSKEQSNRAVSLARSLGDRESLIEALSSQLWAQSGPDDIDALLRVVDEILLLAQVPTLVWLEAHWARIGALLARGDIAAVDAVLIEGGARAHALRMPEAIWQFDRIRAQRRLLDGEIEAASAAFVELRERAEQLGLGYAARFAAVHRDALNVARGGFANAAAHWNIAEEFARPDAGLNMRATLARGAAELGQLPLAKRLLRTLAIADFADFPKDFSYLDSLCQLSIAAVAVADHGCCARLYLLLSPYAAFNTVAPTFFYNGSVSYYLALLGAALDRPQAEQHFVDALRMSEQLGYLGHLGVTARAYADWLDEHRPSATARSRELRCQVEDLARRSGMQWLSPA